MEVSENDNLILNRKNYTMWKVEMINTLIDKELYGFVSVEDRARDRNRQTYYSKTIMREKKAEVLSLLRERLNEKIQRVTQNFTVPNELWEYLEKKYSKKCSSRLMNLIEELHTLNFNSKELSSHVQKFQKINKRLKECGLVLEDRYLNIYLLTSIKKSNRIDDITEFYKSINDTFTDFVEKLKSKIINNPDSDEYSDISRDSFTIEEEEEEIVIPQSTISSTTSRYLNDYDDCRPSTSRGDSYYHSSFYGYRSYEDNFKKPVYESRPSTSSSMEICYENFASPSPEYFISDTKPTSTCDYRLTDQDYERIDLNYTNSLLSERFDSTALKQTNFSDINFLDDMVDGSNESFPEDLNYLADDSSKRREETPKQDECIKKIKDDLEKI